MNTAKPLTIKVILQKHRRCQKGAERRGIQNSELLHLCCACCAWVSSE